MRSNNGKEKDYKVIVYDGFFNEYMWNTEEFFETEKQAIEYAKELYETVDTYTDEVGLYVRGLGMGDWCMFGCLVDDGDGEPCVEECFC